MSSAVDSQIVAAAEAIALALIHMLAGYVRQVEKRDPAPGTPPGLETEEGE